MGDVRFDLRDIKLIDLIRYSKILIQSHIVNFNSAQDLLNQMAAKNFAISHFLKICIEVGRT